MKSDSSNKNKKYTETPHERKRMPSTKTTWGHVADWYEEHLLGKDTYHEKVIRPNLLRLVAAKKGEHILDVPCGQGYFSELFSSQGAEVTAIDIASELIEYAKQRTNTEGIRYLVAASHYMPGVKTGSIDKTTMVLGIQNIKKVSETFAECARVLKKDGELHIVMNHPAFRIPKKSSWEWDTKKQLEYRRVDEYLSESSSAIDMHPGKTMRGQTKAIETISFHRPMQFYFKLLGKNGFAVDKLEEWVSHRESTSGPRMNAENKSKKEFPLFLYLRARKILNTK
jgi:ubiquinone/menaquinone biosynthesis C-methylase UbiE